MFVKQSFAKAILFLFLPWLILLSRCQDQLPHFNHLFKWKLPLNGNAMQIRLGLASQEQTSTCKPSIFFQEGDAKVRLPVFWGWESQSSRYNKIKWEQLLRSPCVINLAMQFIQTLPTNKVMPEMSLVWSVWWCHVSYLVQKDGAFTFPTGLLIWS